MLMMRAKSLFNSTTTIITKLHHNNPGGGGGGGGLGGFLCSSKRLFTNTRIERELEENLKGRRNKRVVALWGNGDYGRLGLGVLDSKWSPAFCSAFGGDGGSDAVVDVSCGGAHTLFLTDTGSVYATGLNDCGQLGISDGRSYTADPVEVRGLPKDIIKISAGYHHSSALTAKGELYTWGKNSSGQLGLGKKAAKIVPVPSKVDSLSKVPIKMASLGFEHSIAVTENGEVLSWGGGGSGRLGHGHNSKALAFLSTASEYIPRLIKGLDGVKIKGVAAGMTHSACIDENGSVFVFGERTLKMGFGKAGTDTTPTIISELPCSEEVACGAYHTCVISSGGELYTWGSNENGCLGIGCTDAVDEPEKVQGPFSRHSVCKVSCGWKHSAAISDGNIYTWGWGGSYGTFSDDGYSSAGQLGLGSDIDYIEPTMVDFGKTMKALQVSCGFNHTAALLELY